MLKKEKGSGLIVLVALIAISGILVTSTALMLREGARQVQLRIDKIKAHYLAQAGVMRAIYDWQVSSATDTARRYAELNTTVTGNQIFKTGCQANFAYFTFTTPSAGWADSLMNNRQLRAWRIRNIHTSVAGPSDNIVFTAVKVSWAGSSGTPTLRTIGLDDNNTSGTVIPVGFYSTGANITLTTPRTLAQGSFFRGNNTYLEWNGNGPDTNSITNVTVQWTFQDDTTTKDSKTHNVLYWNDLQTGSGGRLAERVFSVTSTGQVNQTGGQAFKVLDTVKAVVSGNLGVPAGTNIEIMDWDKVDKNIP